MLELLFSEEDEDREAATDLMRERGTIDAAMECAHAQAREACDHLGFVDSDAALESLTKLARFAVDRAI